MQRRWLGSACAVAALAVACDQAQDPVSVEDFSFTPAFTVTIPTVTVGEAWVCADGPAGDYTYEFTGTNTVPAGTNQVTVASGECKVFATGDAAAPTPPTVTIAALSTTNASHPTGSEVFRHRAAVGGESGIPVSQGVTTSTSATLDPVGNDNAWLVVFFNEDDPPPPPPPVTEGRMTGGGAQIDVGVAKITRGFTIHCDLVLSNNLEINWGKEKWHIDKPLTAATCTDDPNINQKPPRAPFDTFNGEGYGRLNGVDGSFVRFTFIDAGEPGRNDYAAITIWAPGADPSVDAPYLDIGGLLTHGNIQAHYDQPHGNNGNK